MICTVKLAVTERWKGIGTALSCTLFYVVFLCSLGDFVCFLTDSW